MVFDNSKYVAMENATFNNNNGITNQTNINQSLDSDDPFHTLLNHTAISAIADSPPVCYKPKWHLGTGEVLRGRIMGWARDSNATPILWLSGSARAGKSWVQRTIVQSCIDEGLYGGSFFFSIQQSETNQQNWFIPTLAAQLAENIPGVKWYIERAIRMDRRMFTRGLESQAEGLILKPLQELDGSISNRLRRLFWSTLKALVAHQEDPNPLWTSAIVIIIDGLDECVDEKEQERILRLIHTLATHSHFPFRFIIASRPEYAIRTAFSSPPLSNDTLILRLDNYKVEEEDLMRFMKAEFSRLKSNHPISDSIPADWPSIEDQNALITQASGRINYLSLVMKHLGNRYLNPVSELQHILGHRPFTYNANFNPFAELDTLYNSILRRSNADISLLKIILHAIIHDKPQPSATPEENLDILLGLGPGTSASTLVDLHSLLNINSPTRRPTFYDKSLEDFLTTHSRAGDFYQSSDQTHVQLTLAYHELGRQHEVTGMRMITTGYVWRLCLLTMSHACSVSDWSLFEKEFTTNTLPAFIKSVVQNDTTVVTERERLGSYLRRYHAFFCTSEDGCLPRCKELGDTYKPRSDTKIGEANGDMALCAVLDTSFKAGCKCESGRAASRVPTSVGR